MKTYKERIEELEIDIKDLKRELNANDDELESDSIRIALKEEFLLGMKEGRLLTLKEVFCSICGFPKEWERDIVLVNNNIVNLIELIKDEGRCEECNHYKDGSTILKIKPLLHRYIEIGKKQALKEVEDKIEKLIEKWYEHTCFDIPRLDLEELKKRLRRMPKTKP